MEEKNGAGTTGMDRSVQSDESGVRHYGKIRGGCNEFARFFLHIRPDDEMTKEEYHAMFSLWDEQFGLSGDLWCGWRYRIDNRREFALIPTIIRKAQRIGFDVSTTMWDVGIKGEVKHSEKPDEFWRTLAMAQAFFRE